MRIVISIVRFKAKTVEFAQRLGTLQAIQAAEGKRHDRSSGHEVCTQTDPSRGNRRPPSVTVSFLLRLLSETFASSHRPKNLLLSKKKSRR